jgi:hypothetical protein
MYRYYGWIGNVFLIVGLTMMGSKYNHAFLFTAIGEFLWTVKAAKTKSWDIFVLSIVFMAIAVINWVQWNF